MIRATAEGDFISREFVMGAVWKSAASATWSGWRRWLPGPVTGSLTFALALSVIAALALALNLSRQRESFAWIEHTNDVIRTIGSLERALLEAESGERGYLLTGDSSYLNGYSRSRAEIPRLLQTLANLVSDNADQTQHLHELRGSIEARLAEFGQVIALGPSRQVEALEVLKTARSRQLTPKIENQLAQLRHTEFALLDERQQTADRVAVFGTFIAAAMGLLALLSAGIGAFLLERQWTVSQLRAANTELAQSRDSLKNREAHLEAILATVPDAMVIIDDNGLIQSFSATAEQLFERKLDEVQGRNVSILMPSPYQEEHDGYLHRYRTTGEPHIIGSGRVVVGRRKNGSTFPMELSVGEALLSGQRQFVGFIRDLTQREERDRLLHEVQSELLHVSRLSTMGEMASALAHELNQPLAAMGNYLNGSRRLLENIPDTRAIAVKGALDKASEQALRAGQVIQRLRDFVARGETERRVESLKRLVEEACTLALVAAKEQSVQVIYRLDPALDRVLVDKVQIQQVLVNLLRNALEAMQHSMRRELVVSTAPEIDHMVGVSVADTGSGIDPDIASRLFQPFVSTKRQGMGIGLSICRTIIESHGGQMVAEPNPEGGTIFRFTLRLLPPDETYA